MNGVGVLVAAELIKKWWRRSVTEGDLVVLRGPDGSEYVGSFRRVAEALTTVLGSLAHQEALAIAIEEIEQAQLPLYADIEQGKKKKKRKRRSKVERDDIRKLHAQIFERIKAIEARLKDVKASIANIGHNNPPTLMEAELSPDDILQLENALERLKKQPIIPKDEGKAALEDVEVVVEKAGALQSWFERQGDTFSTEAIRSPEDETGKDLVRTAFVVVIERLFSLGETVIRWLRAAFPPF